MPTVKVFKYIEPLDAFIPTDEYAQLAAQLGLVEWNPVVWIGRLFALDNNYGEHWFDNWEERESLADGAARIGIPSDELLIVVPDRFTNGRDGPCHPPNLRKKFWTDVLQSLELSYDTLFEEARRTNMHVQEYFPEASIDDLEQRIAAIQSNL